LGPVSQSRRPVGQRGSGPVVPLVSARGLLFCPLARSLATTSGPAGGRDAGPPHAGLSRRRPPPGRRARGPGGTNLEGRRDPLWPLGGRAAATGEAPTVSRFQDRLWFRGGLLRPTPLPDRTSSGAARDSSRGVLCSRPASPPRSGSP